MCGAGIEQHYLEQIESEEEEQDSIDRDSTPTFFKISFNTFTISANK